MGMVNSSPRQMTQGATSTDGLPRRPEPLRHTVGSCWNTLRCKLQGITPVV